MVGRAVADHPGLQSPYAREGDQKTGFSRFQCSKMPAWVAIA
jgi:hypothetical protein